MIIHWLDHPDDWPMATPLQQAPAYGRAMAALGARVRWARIRDGDRVLAHAQVLERGRLRLISRGPVWAADCDRRAVLRRLARWPGLTLATPDEAVAGPGLLPLITPRHHAIWDLKKSENQLLSELCVKFRNRFRKAGGLRIQVGDAQVAEALMAAEAAQCRARGYRALPHAFLRHWAGESLVLHWSPAAQVEAGMIFLRHGNFASYHLGWTSETARQAFAHGPMLWQAALTLQARGVVALDLGTVGAANPGLARFKLGTGARVHALGATVLVLPL